MSLRLSTLELVGLRVEQRTGGNRASFHVTFCGTDGGIPITGFVPGRGGKGVSTGSTCYPKPKVRHQPSTAATSDTSHHGILLRPTPTKQPSTENDNALPPDDVADGGAVQRPRWRRRRGDDAAASEHNMRRAHRPRQPTSSSSAG